MVVEWRALAASVSRPTVFLNKNQPQKMQVKAISRSMSRYAIIAVVKTQISMLELHANDLVFAVSNLLVRIVGGVGC